ncbi:hypothetical protein GQ607_017948, partial [Colletotrichum asianum]
MATPNQTNQNGESTHDDNSEDRQWSIDEIISHRVSPTDPTRVELQIEWTSENGQDFEPTWEPECNIQEDAPDMWKEYITANSDYRDVLGENKDLWHLFRILSHDVQYHGGKKPPE